METLLHGGILKKASPEPSIIPRSEHGQARRVRNIPSSSLNIYSLRVKSIIDFHRRRSCQKDQPEGKEIRWIERNQPIKKVVSYRCYSGQGLPSDVFMGGRSSSGRNAHVPLPGGLEFLDSLYFCVISAATIGYGDFVPTTPLSEDFCDPLQHQRDSDVIGDIRQGAGSPWA